MVAAPIAIVAPAAADALQAAWLAVTMNGVAQGDVLVQRRAGRVYVPAEALRRWGVTLDGLAIVTLDHQPYVALGGDGLAYTVEEATQALRLTVAPARLQATSLPARRVSLGRVARSGWGGFVNYDLLADRSYGSTSVSGLFEVGLFSPLGSGTSTFVARSSGPGANVVRLESGWTIDDPDRLRSLRIGDSVTRYGIGGTPFRFAGLQFGRSFETQPGYVTLPLPTLGGAAALPSVADIYVNNVLTGHQDVRPGPFAITDVPVVSGAGQVSLVVRDMLGRQTTISQSYYTAPDLLRAGLSDYSFEAGVARRDFGTRSFSYGSAFAAATYRYGLSDTLTGEAHAEATPRLQQAGAAADFVLPGVALITLGAAASHAPSGAGAMVTAGIQRNAPRISYGVTAELLSDAYVTYGSSYKSPRRSVTAFVGMPVRFGSIGGSFTTRSYRSAPSLQITSLNATIHATRFASFNLIGSKTWGAVADTAVQLLMLVPLGRRTSASAGVSAHGAGESAVATLQRDLPVGDGIGYRVSGEAGEIDRLDGEVSLQTGVGTYSVEGSWTDQGGGVRLSASGSIGMIDGNVFAARPLTQSFAAVRVGDFPDVGVYADNQLVGHTGRNGLMIVPNLRMFDDNPLRIDTDDVPMTAQIVTDKQTVRPPRRSGVHVDFAVVDERDAILTVVLADGTALPKGARVVSGSGEETVSAAGGEIYLAHLRATTTVTVALEKTACSFDVTRPADSGAQPRLGPFTCALRPS
ncbi:fimbria/pilus outer membrane usher protein [Sphingomonas sp. PAMC 26605]|uniref:fimbria/pilus outer membrane usher protein n=1 Tax=Sphingomonas sp. PAMC 26605 TaxID=1112214 RepID=UPI00026CCA6A|nr:fimbria/pilus outer membrane usher protein [Sphingomonas sp. PAMC 26605]